MLTGFEELTKPLSEAEMKQAELIAECMLKSHVGQENIVTSTEICKGMNKYHPELPKLTDVRLRKEIFWLRVTDRCPLLMATSRGYFVGEVSQEGEVDVRDGIRSVDERGYLIFATRDALLRQYKAAYENPTPIRTQYGKMLF